MLSPMNEFWGGLEFHLYHKDGQTFPLNTSAGEE
jgi:hypothetical protein